MRCLFHTIKLKKIWRIKNTCKNLQKNKIETVFTILETNLSTEILLSLTDFKSINICELESYNIDELLKIFDNCLKKRDFDEQNFVDALRIKSKDFEYLKTAYASLIGLKSTILEVNQHKELDGNNLQLLNFIEQEIKSENYFILKYLWVSLGCSAGERAYLNILSDINSLPYLKYFSDSAVRGINRNILLFIDEPDLYCHPDWQRKMLYELIETFELLYEEHSVHIIFSTHSPLFLSDIPQENIVLLDKTEKGVSAVKKNMKQTFGANIFDLYNNSFLLDSFIGEFATQKIGAAIRKISEWYNQNIAIPCDELHKAEELVDLIGEPILKNKLKSILHQLQKRA